MKKVRETGGWIPGVRHETPDSPGCVDLLPQIVGIVRRAIGKARGHLPPARDERVGNPEALAGIGQRQAAPIEQSQIEVAVGKEVLGPHRCLTVPGEAGYLLYLS